MPKSAFKQKIDELLKCPICLDQFTKPKSLKCKHSFCAECLKSLKNQKECPVCRGKITEKILTEAKANRKLSNLLTAVGKKDDEKVKQLVEKFEEMAKPKGKGSTAGSKAGAGEKKKNQSLEKAKPKAKPKNKATLKQQEVELEKMFKAEAARDKAGKGSVSAVFKRGTTVAPRPRGNAQKYNPKSANNKRKDKKADKNGQPKKLTKTDKKLYKDEFTPESSSDDTDESGTSSDSTLPQTSTSEDEGTTRDISSDSDECTDSSSSNDSDSEESDDDSSTEDDRSCTDDHDEESDTEIEFKIGKKVAVFPDVTSNRKNHVNGVIKYKVQLTGQKYATYGIHLREGTSMGLGLKITGKQIKELSEKQKKWWEDDKKKKLWVQSYRLCESKLVCDI